MIEQDNEKLTFAIKKNNELIEELVFELEEAKDEIKELKDKFKDFKHEMREVVTEDIEGRVCRLINENIRKNWFAIIFGLIFAAIFYYIDKNF